MSEKSLYPLSMSAAGKLAEDFVEAAHFLVPAALTSLISWISWM